jgi:hypothetical protein
MTPTEFAVNTVNTFVQSQSIYAVGGRSVSLSACRLNETENEKGEKYSPIEKLTEKINELSVAFINKLDPDKTFASLPFKSSSDEKKIHEKLKQKSSTLEQLRRALLFSQWRAQTFLFEQAIDVKDFAICLERECSFYGENLDDIAKICNEIAHYAKTCIISHSNTGVDYQYSSGL